MNTLHYYTQRLLPFFLVYFTYEVMEFGILTMRNPIGEGYGSIVLLALLNETLISFWFSILPYLLYLLVLPAAFHGGRKDRRVTSFLFVVFCVVNAVEEMAEVVSGDQFHLLTAELLHHPQKVWESWGGLESG